MSGLKPDDLTVGEWITVKARVVEQTSPHPEEAVLMLRSHNEDYRALVHQDYLGESTTPPENWPTCHAGLKTTLQVGPSLDAVEAVIRCTKSNGHPGKHKASSPSVEEWDSGEPGQVYIEED